MTNEMLQTNDTNTSATLAIPLLVAKEISLKNWRLVMAPEGGARNRVKTVEAGNYLELEKVVADARERFKLPPQTPLVFCYEAGRDGFYPYRRLTEAGHEVWVIDSASIEVSRRQKQAKSDGIDGDKLAELMQRKARGEKKALRIVQVPSLEVENERLLPMEREIILHDLGRLRNQIESILFTQGYRGIPKTAAALKSWVAERGVALPAPGHAGARLPEYAVRRGLLSGGVAGRLAGRQTSAAPRRAALAGRDGPYRRRLRRLPGPQGRWPPRPQGRKAEPWTGSAEY